MKYGSITNTPFVGKNCTAVGLEAGIYRKTTGKGLNKKGGDFNFILENLELI